MENLDGDAAHLAELFGRVARDHHLLGVLDARTLGFLSCLSLGTGLLQVLA